MRAAPLLVAVAANKNASEKAEQNVAYCPATVTKFLQHTLLLLVDTTHFSGFSSGCCVCLILLIRQ